MSWREDETQAFEESSEVERELERYVGRVHGMPSADFVDHVMSAVERAPAPRRGIIGALLGIAPGLHRPLQATALVAVVVGWFNWLGRDEAPAEPADVPEREGLP